MEKNNTNMSEQAVQALIDEFNALVGSDAWTSARAAHDKAMIDAFISNGIDISAIYSDGKISFAHKISMDKDGKSVVIID